MVPGVGALFFVSSLVSLRVEAWASRVHNRRLAASACSSPLSLDDYLRESDVPDEVKAVVQGFAKASLKIARRLATAAITNAVGSVDETTAKGSSDRDQQKKLDVIANEAVRDALVESGCVLAFASEEEDDVTRVDATSPSPVFVAYDPLDGSSNIDCASPTGTIFGIYSSSNLSELRGRDTMLAAGYILYSSSTEYVLSIKGRGVQGFTLDPAVGGYLLSRADIKLPRHGPYYSLNEGRSSDWPEGLSRYVEDVKNGRGRQQGVRYSLRYVCSLVADVNRTLLYGGWAGNPRAHLRLLFEAAPLAFIVESADGRGSDGATNLLDVTPCKIHHRLPVFLGSAEDIDELLSYGDVQQTKVGKY